MFDVVPLNAPKLEACCAFKCRAKPYIKGITKIRANKAIAESRPLDPVLYPTYRPARNSVDKLRRNRRGAL
jgi:hypothetical protein